ncbi:vWA domain-containing protein [Albimonas pacifica]|uniref:Ca-activated chloride channel family protein n=1 Tax=Albimonas pacifica TaxID=1114924 RepID=A0A1I3E4T9_9RHOB|nr:VWA domain-containing protein [Albimonas pacifica]SFH94042.1 Ca-activated chloride channel family protein [Albimonas pacifica]
MSLEALSLALEAFRFLRPWWLLALPAIALLWAAVRRAHARPRTPAARIAPHLTAALTLDAARRRRPQPIDGVALALVCCALGAAGPAWTRAPDPFAAQAAPAVVVLKVAPSMEGTDLAPSRLERGRQKIRDFLDLRAGARTALVAYAGSAHVVIPMTEDAGVIAPYLAALTPQTMPREGDAAGAALALAASLLAAEGGAPGGVLLVADGVSPAETAALNASPVPLAVLATLPPGARDRGLDALDAPVIAATPDEADLRRIDGLLNAAWARAQLADESRPWEDRGRWLAWPAALLTLLWFRRGWTMRWAALALATALLPGAPLAQDGARNLRAEAPAAAPGLFDLGGPVAGWFLTPDQQGDVAARRREYDRAAALYADPYRRGWAQYRDGQYKAAVETLARLESADAAMLQGLASIRAQAYRDGVRAFETALRRDPQDADAAANLALARRIVDWVERQQEASDTGDQPDPGADDVTYDNEENRGREMQVPRDQDAAGRLLTADQWMRTVDTRPGDFLRQRFALEAAQAPATGDGGTE